MRKYKPKRQGTAYYQSSQAHKLRFGKLLFTKKNTEKNYLKSN